MEEQLERGIDLNGTEVRMFFTTPQDVLHHTSGEEGQEWTRC